MGRKSDARERILESALQLFHQSGYANVGVEDIMKSSNVGKSSFYHFFKSKEALGEAVLDEYQRKLENGVFGKAFHEANEPLERPIKLATEICSQNGLTMIGCLAGNSAAENSTVSDRLRDKTRGILETMKAYFAEAYSDAVREMDLLPHTPVDELAEASVAYIQGIMLLCKAQQSSEPMRLLGPMIRNLWEPYRVRGHSGRL